MKIAIFTGPRQLSAADEQLVRRVTREVIQRGFTVYVGDAAGVDRTVWDETFNCLARPQVFQPLPVFNGRSANALAERSARMIKAAIAASKGDHILCIGFPDEDCPEKISPQKTWPGNDEITWATLAMAQGHNIETWVFTLHHANTCAPAAWSGTWKCEPFLDTVSAWRYYDVSNEFAFWPQAIAAIKF